MAQITKTETLTFDTIEAADSFIRNANSNGGRVRFQVMAAPFLPTEEGRGFEGCACISVSRAQLRKAVADAGRTLVTQRGAKIRLHVSAADPDMLSSSASIAFY